MNFSEKLNEYIEILNCTAQEISEASGLSATTLSRYRSGERIPKIHTDTFENLCHAITLIARKKQADGITKDSVTRNFLNCSDMWSVDFEHLRQNFNTLLSVLNINTTKLGQYINYDSSTISRIRNGSRHPSEPVKFTSAVAAYIAEEMNSPSKRIILAELLGCPADILSDNAMLLNKVQDYLLTGPGMQEESISGFLTKLDSFDLNEYIKAIHFDELKIPPAIPFHFPTSKTYFGLNEMMESELDFLKATVLSKSMDDIIMYSDMPMEEMANDSEFPKKWMFGMALMLKKGLHLNQIHYLNRSFKDMMLGLESWIPMYMTGQVSPYYLKGSQNNTFLHFLKVSGAAALSGEAITGYHSDGKYYLTKAKNEISYYRKRAQELLYYAQPLMNIYREDSRKALRAFLLSDSHTDGKRRNILSSLPLYTMEKNFLERFLQKHSPSQKDIQDITSYAALQRQTAEEIMKNGILEDEIPLLSREEFIRYPLSLSLSGMFYETDILYTYEDYLEHLKQTEKYAADHPNYILNKTSAHAFRNLKISIHEGQWAMVSKNKAPAIHFLIHHPELRNAIENFLPPVTENL